MEGSSSYSTARTRFRATIRTGPANRSVATARSHTAHFDPLASPVDLRQFAGRRRFFGHGRYRLIKVLVTRTESEFEPAFAESRDIQRAARIQMTPPAAD